MNEEQAEKARREADEAAFNDGKNILSRYDHGGIVSAWVPCHEPTWHWARNDYRIAPGQEESTTEPDAAPAATGLTEPVKSKRCEECGGTGIVGDCGPGRRNSLHEWQPCDCRAGKELPLPLSPREELLMAALEDISLTAHCIAKAGPAAVPDLAEAWRRFDEISVKADQARARAKALAALKGGGA